ncbi:unnamed protein product [Brugia timori]|uniref:Transcriptional regulator n=1 Tax=Brugia timori TaxID=42155 RepID=A0A0R3Q8S3_9BILA|nr:unnamed protein product [Brugia timori]
MWRSDERIELATKLNRTVSYTNSQFTYGNPNPLRTTVTYLSAKTGIHTAIPEFTANPIPVNRLRKPL